MSRTIVISTAGTLGDHLPFVALGKVLAACGHRVRMAVNAAMVPYAREADLEAVDMGTPLGQAEAQRGARSWNHWHTVRSGTAFTLNTERMQEEINIQYPILREACVDADLLISTTIRLVGSMVHAGLGIPWLTVAPVSSDFFETPDAEPAQPSEHLEKVFERWNLLAHLPRLTDRNFRADRTLLASSPRFFQPDPKQYPDIQVTGFWFPEPVSWHPDHELVQFLESDPPPMALTFSSLPLEQPDEVLAVHIRAAERLGHPLLIQRGWGFSDCRLPPGTDKHRVRFADFIPHDWLFSRVAGAIQHGGIGSLAQAMRQGCPVIVEPYGNDQFFNAMRVMQLGIGLAVNPTRLTGKGLAGAMEKLLSGPCRERARRLGRQIGQEQGLAAAADFIESRYLG